MTGSTESTAGRGRRRERLISVALLAVLLLGAAFRFYNVNWDRGTYHIHPDERHTTMVVTRIRWPGGLDDYIDCRQGLLFELEGGCGAYLQLASAPAEYFDTSRSPLNARNVDTVYFYGTLPLFLTKAVGTLGDLIQLQYAEATPDPGAYLAANPPPSSYDQIHLVGRILSALFDLGTVVLTFFLGRRLFDWRVGLGASFLLALTVLNIQGAHYFAVDTFLTFFVALTLWFTLDVAEGHGWRAFVNLGLAMGLTMASKVSVFLLVAVVALAVWLRIRRGLLAGGPTRQTLARAAGGLALAVAVAFLVFRVAQPYAWAGPNYDGWDSVPGPWGERLEVFKVLPEPIRAVFLPNPQWVADIVSAGAQQTGEADLPWGRQWTERAPWLWPLENMVLWTLGVPLGVTAWLGVALAAFLVVRTWWRRRASQVPAHEGPVAGSGPPALPASDLVLIPLAWVVLSFGWQGMQYVKSVRYFMPIHPYLAIFAAFLLVAAWDWARARGRWLRVAAAGLAGVVFLGTFLWAVAFIQIYTEPVTRVQATRWIYENVESGATLRYRTPGGQAGQMQLPVPSQQTYASDGAWYHTAFVPPDDVMATEIVMNHLTGQDGAVEGTFEVQITSDDATGEPLSQAQIEATFGGESGERHVIDIPDVPLEGGQTYWFESRAVRGAPLVSRGAVIANEHFDDPLPFNMFGYTAFGGGLYRSLDVARPNSQDRVDQLPLYDEDTPEKLELLLDALDQADYIIMSSGRLWQSIPRLPMRYPMTTRYYELLFAGELGFDKAAEFHAYPRLLGIEFDDTWAEEQFTVYDHPKVLIYKKADDYDRERVRTLLSAGIEWDQVARWLNPRDVPKWRREQAALERAGAQQDELMLTEEQREVQQQGGTWASIFDRNSLPNRWPTLSWLVLLGLVGLAALPLTLGILGWLPDRGYVLARPVGVLLLGWLSWMLTNLTPLHYSRGTILLALGLITAVSYGSLLLPGQRRRLATLWDRNKRLILVNELLFLVFFAIFWLIRWGNPDLWHAWRGGEKPMDLAYLNAVIKSTEFPPYDPWFAGGYLNYYYFGQVMVGTLIKLVGIVPNVAYNLVIPTWFAMTAMGAFSLTYNLVTGEGERAGRRAIVFGLLGAIFVAILGNLGEIHLVLLKAGEGVAETFQSTIPGLSGLVRTVIGSFELIFGGKALPIRIDEWYWNASRAIPAGPSESVITEFPFFTFLYADLHAHLIAMPLTFVSLALALALSRREGSLGRWRDALAVLPALLLWALTIGALRTTNTWDVPPHLLVVLGALSIAAFGRWSRAGGRRGSLWGPLLSIAWQFALVFALAWSLLYRPFWANYGSYYNSLAVWTGTRTPLWAYLVVHGLFLFVIVTYLGVTLAREWRRVPLLCHLVLTLRHWTRRDRLRQVAHLVGVRGVPVPGLVWLALVLLVLLEVFFLVPGLVAFTRADADLAATGSHAYRGLAVLGLGLPIALAGLLYLLQRRLSSGRRLWTYLVLLALAMTLGVEVVVIQGDIGRMNTVFKFYLQAWLFWGVAAAVALAWLAPWLRRGFGREPAPDTGHIAAGEGETAVPPDESRPGHEPAPDTGQMATGEGEAAVLPEESRPDRGTDGAIGQRVWLAILVALLLFAALYPPLATSAKVRDRFDPELGPGLDGWEYMETATYWDPAGEQFGYPNGVEYALRWDLEAIRWLLDNVVGSPVILEGHTSEYRWGARYSINTGLPTVLGWNWHQRQQRAAANPEEVWARATDIATIYNAQGIMTVEPLLEKYDVRYIVVGPLERVYYDEAGLNKFEWMVDEGSLRVAFSNEKVTIYEVTW